MPSKQAIPEMVPEGSVPPMPVQHHPPPMMHMPSTPVQLPPNDTLPYNPNSAGGDPKSGASYESPSDIPLPSPLWGHLNLSTYKKWLDLIDNNEDDDTGRQRRGRRGGSSSGGSGAPQGDERRGGR